MMTSPAQAPVLVIIFIASFLVPMIVAPFPPPFGPPGISDPTGPGARCVNKTMMNRTDFPNNCYDYLDFDLVYFDNYTPLRSTLGVLAMGGTGGFIPTDCDFWSHRLWCGWMFRPCYEVTVPVTNETIAVGAMSCRLVCEKWGTICYELIKQAVENIPDTVPADLDIALSCDPPWPLFYGYPQSVFYPNTTTYNANVTLDNGTISFLTPLPTYCGGININTTFSPTSCPAGFHLVDGYACAFNCPQPLLTDSEYDDITIMVSVVGWVSLVCTGFLLITLLLDPSKRQYPSVLSIFFTICVMYVSFSFCLGNMIGWRDLWCSDPETFNEFGDPGCTIQGMIFVYFTLASVLWWLVIAFNLFLVVVVGIQMRQLAWKAWFLGLNRWKGWLKLETLLICYHLFCWLPPIITLIIAVSNEKLGFGGKDLWCTVHSGDTVLFDRSPTGKVQYSGGDPANIWNLLLITVPILVIVLLGVALLTTVIFFGVFKTGWRFLLQQWRLFLFLAFYVYIYTFVFSFQIDLAVKADAQYEAYAEYLTCTSLVQVYLTLYGNTGQRSCELNNQVSYPLWFIVAFNEAAQGIMVFLIFGSSWRLFKSWYYLFRDPRRVLRAETNATASDMTTTMQNIPTKMIDSDSEEDEEEEDGGEDGEPGDGDVRTSTTDDMQHGATEPDSSASSWDDGEDGEEMTDITGRDGDDTDDGSS